MTCSSLSCGRQSTSARMSPRSAKVAKVGVRQLTRFLSLLSFLSCFFNRATAGASILCGERLLPKSKRSMGCEASTSAEGGPASES